MRHHAAAHIEGAYYLLRGGALSTACILTASYSHKRRLASIQSDDRIFVFRLVFPTLLCYTGGHLREYDLPSQTLVQAKSLEGTVNGNSNVTSIDMDENFWFVVGEGHCAISVIHRRTHQVVWSLNSHIRLFGAPTCYTPELLPYPTVPRFQQRRLYPMPAPTLLQPSHVNVPNALDVQSDRWLAIHPDKDTDTLVMLAYDAILLLIGYQAHLLHGATPKLVYYTFPPLPLVSERLSQPNLRWAMGKNWCEELSADMPPQLSVHNGRVVVVHGIVTMLDLRVPSPLASRRDKPIFDSHNEPPSFTVFQWSDVPVEGEISQFVDCSSVQMDQSGIYCVAQQCLDMEFGVDHTHLPDDYQEMCNANFSSMVTAFRFDSASKPAFRYISRRVLEEALDSLIDELSHVPDPENDDRWVPFLVDGERLHAVDQDVVDSENAEAHDMETIDSESGEASSQPDASVDMELIEAVRAEADRLETLRDREEDEQTRHVYALHASALREHAQLIGGDHDSDSPAE
mgnify:FL=1